MLPLEGVRIVAVGAIRGGAVQHAPACGPGRGRRQRSRNIAEGGDVGRYVRHSQDPLPEGDSLFFQAFNRNKRSVALDLKQQAGREVLHDLVRSADGLLNNLRGDQPARLGLTYDALKAANPAIVCVHLSAYGREGPRAAWPGYDYLMQAEAGYLSVTGEPGSPPARMGLSMVDLATGVQAALAMTSGILAARAGGKGMDLDVSLYDTAMSNLGYLACWYLTAGIVQGREPRSSHPNLTPSQLYRTRDGWLFIMCNKEKFWGELADALGRPEWKDDPRFRELRRPPRPPGPGDRDAGRGAVGKDHGRNGWRRYRARCRSRPCMTSRLPWTRPSRPRPGATSGWSTVPAAGSAPSAPRSRTGEADAGPARPGNGGGHGRGVGGPRLRPGPDRGAPEGEDRVRQRAARQVQGAGPSPNSASASNTAHCAPCMSRSLRLPCVTGTGKAELHDPDFGQLVSVRSAPGPRGRAARPPPSRAPH